jgi:hypothetical protein
MLLIGEPCLIPESNLDLRTRVLLDKERRAVKKVQTMNWTRAARRNRRERVSLRRRILAGTALCVLLLVPAAASPPSLPAAVVFEETFDVPVPTMMKGKGRIIDTPDGFKGFSVDRAARQDFGGMVLQRSFLLSLKGKSATLEFWLQRRSAASGVRSTDPVLEFVDRDDRNFLTIYVLWEGSEYGGGGEIFLDWKRSAVPAYDVNIWGEVIPLGFTPKVGEWIHVAFTYGPNESDKMVIVNGTPLTSAYPPLGSLAQVRGTAMEPVTMTGGTLDLSNIHEVKVGAEGKNWDKGVGRGVRYLEHSVLDDLRIHDQVVTAFDLTRRGGTGEALEIRTLAHDADLVAGFSGKLVGGDVLTVLVEGTPGAEATFDVVSRSDRRGSIHLDWRGFGVYLEEKVFFEEDEINLRDVREYRVYVDREPLGAITAETEAVEILDVQEQSYTIEGLEIETPYYTEVMAFMDGGVIHPVFRSRTGLPMEEDPELPGRYAGTLQVEHQDVYDEAVIVGRLSRGDATAELSAPELLEIDGSLTIAVLTSPDMLEADETSTSEILVTVTDANEEPVAGHEIRFLLVTTSEYTGVVGGGLFVDEVGASLRRDFRGITDMFGQVTATYTAGFAAKTAIIVARDMLSNDTGAGYVRNFIRAQAELELEAVQEVAGKALGYALTLTSSDEWLTADGESRARITAFLTRDGIPVEGHRIGFQVTAGTGSIRAVSDTTDADGKARAVYTAGKKIGIVLIRAVAHKAGVSGTVQIELRSDAPAKIAITLSEDLLPADGRSTAEVDVVVTDINDNPNEGVEVEYEVAIGSGRLRKIEPVTDDRGASSARYVAGTIPGKVHIQVTVRSAVPTEEEMLAARNLALAVPDYAFF